MIMASQISGRNFQSRFLPPAAAARCPQFAAANVSNVTDSFETEAGPSHSAGS